MIANERQIDVKVDKYRSLYDWGFGLAFCVRYGLWSDKGGLISNSLKNKCQIPDSREK